MPAIADGVFVIGIDNMSLKHWPIMVKILIALSLLGLVSVGAAVFSTTSMRAIDQTYSGLVQHNKGAMLLSQASRQLAWFTRTTLALAGETSEAGNRARLDELAAIRKALDRSIAQAGAMLAPYAAELGQLSAKVATIDKQCADSVHYAASVTSETEDIIALHRLIAECDTVVDQATLAAQRLSDRIVADSERDTAAASAYTARIMDWTYGTILGGLVVASIVAIWVSRTGLLLPIKDLVKAMGVLAHGKLDLKLDTDRRDEFGTLAHGFNHMTGELAALIAQVQKSCIEVNTSIVQISTTAREQEATATEVAATTTEIGATSKEISATSKALVQTMDEVTLVAEQSAALADSGQASLARMEATMQKVIEAAGSINAKLAILSEKAGNINQMVTTITKVADQTNLLSLNAAIEAEKAGEYGRGFAVVATEIRRLADQTAVATRDIDQMVREIQTAVSASVMGMDRFSEQVRHGMQDVQQTSQQLSQIIQQVQTLAPRIDTVNDGMQAQATGAEQISETLVHLTEAARQTVDSLRDSAEAIKELGQVVGAMRGSIARFVW
jgi:methyl-accepting chemotaxis protein WspA